MHEREENGIPAHTVPISYSLVVVYLKLSTLLNDVPVLSLRADPDLEITGISYDTRDLQPGALFAALPGYKTDGALFIQEALAKGAAAILCHEAPRGKGPWVLVPDAREALALTAANWFGRPAQGMTCIAVTGTNGKTTTTYLMKAVLEDVLGAKVGLVGTNQNMIGDEILPTGRTTPESYELQALLRQMADGGCTHVVMETSSHALVLHRVTGLRFAAGIFTNLTQDHLDFHGTMDAYRDAKGQLFRQSDLAVLNLDDEAGRYYAGTVPCPKFTYSERRDEADLTAKNIRLFPSHVEFEAVGRSTIGRIFLPIPGGFSIYNALGVVACSLALGLELPEISAALRRAKGVKGRVEVVPVPAAYTVIIDYAHTPDALENILITVRDLTDRRVICLFGCGGNRDRAKRPIMGAVAASLADLTVVTSDNPRTEDPMAIIRDILPGLPSGVKYLVEPDRRAAIRLALSEARTGDVVVLAGKGHETYQEVGVKQIHLDEREEVAAFYRKPG